MGFIFFLLTLFVLILFIGFSILGNILRVLLGLGKRNQGQQQRTYTRTHTQSQWDNAQQTSSQANARQRTTAPSGSKKKIFADDEGEYVDFEEVQ